ncbi:FGGY-family carbohydrate kinase [Aureimonas leprariae]|uniref:Carbohydrate kinase n=1 Tax=Plantimonas leprariae TaxID=2615207 RepID=A0A7V7PP58_9HYPH|nr:FGGY-family carbohydrate kinase [Aureimonas leprariae]KAB0679602.1 carbohydrate kinase [Aureimonas leprariae]
MTGTARHVAVIDVGKTNAKLAVHDLDTGADVFVRTEPNRVRTDGPYPHFDVERLWDFLTDALGQAARAHPVDAISVTTHGACAALVGDDGLALPILDYESDAPEATRRDYDAARPPFAETFSPRLPNGLNVGAQLFWLARAFPDAFAKARHVLTYPQYWVWRLTGVAAGELTSLGCHTDIWQPAAGTYSALVESQGWGRLFPPVRSAFDAVAPLRPDLAQRLGLGGRDIPVHCGIHDSNASLLPHVLARQAPFTVLSTGTWIIAMAVGGSLDGLDPARDTLANVDALGRAVPSSRFMGGREFDILTEHLAAEPTADEIAAVLGSDAMALPSFAAGTGPFPNGRGEWVETLEMPGARVAAASLYCALMTGEALDLVGAAGPTIVEGPFARNRLFIEAVGALTGRPAAASPGATGTTAGAALLAAGARPHAAAPPDAPSPPDPHRDAIRRYAERWRARLPKGG